MIHYHGTPVGGKVPERAHFLQGRHALISYAHKIDIGLAADVCQSFVLDNGAFTTWKQGKTFDLDGYFSWVSQWSKHPGLDWALIPDAIGEGSDDNDRLLEQWPSELPGVPVWHMDEPPERLRRLSQQFRTVALGSAGKWDRPGSSDWWVRMAEVLDDVCDEHGRPPCRLHGLRMLAPKVFSFLPLSSADSTNASVNAGSLGRFGMYVPPSRWQRAEVIAERIESYNSAPRWDGTAQRNMDSCVDELSFLDTPDNTGQY